MADNVHKEHQRLRAEVGTRMSVELGVLTEADFARFATASGMAWPPADSDVAVAPHLYLSSVMSWGPWPSEDDLATDGTGISETRGFPLDGLRLMGAGQELEFHAPVRAGTRVRETTVLEDVQLKHGRTGDFLTMQLVRQFIDEADTLLVTCRETFVGR